jgi:hypothetical protein
MPKKTPLTPLQNASRKNLKTLPIVKRAREASVGLVTLLAKSSAVAKDL